MIDPQQRLFLEIAVHALEHAGCDPARRRPGRRVRRRRMNTYLFNNLASRSEVLKAPAGSRSSSATTRTSARVAYKLDLRGPAVTVQTACSTSLVAVHTACQALLSGECDVALAGGVSVATPQQQGYHYIEGGVDSPDGHCRAFDARAKGTVAGSGVGAVVLKRLGDAVSAGDRIYAVVRAPPSTMTARARSATQRPASTVSGMRSSRPRRWPMSSRRASPTSRRAWYRHPDGRPHRGAGTHLSIPRTKRSDRFLHYRFGKDEHRPRGHGGRHRWTHQDGPRASASPTAAIAELRPAESAARTRVQPVHSEHGAQGLTGPLPLRAAVSFSAWAERMRMSSWKKHRQPQRQRPQ